MCKKPLVIVVVVDSVAAMKTNRTAMEAVAPLSTYALIPSQELEPGISGFDSMYKVTW